MVKRVLSLISLATCSLLLCACAPTVSLETKSGALGHRADKFMNYANIEKNTDVEMKNNVIYMGKEYENNTFGPGAVRFVFDK